MSRSEELGAVVDEQDARRHARVGGRLGERIAEAESREASGAAAQLVRHRLQAHQAAHAGEQRDVVDRLGQEVVGAGLEPLHAVGGLVERRHHDDRHMGGARDWP